MFRQVRELREITEISNRIINAIRKKHILMEVGDTLVKSIRKRVRAGYGAEEDESIRKKLASLKPSTIEIRRKFEDLSPETRPTKSNLTMTGKMLNDLTYKATDKDVKIFFSTVRSAKVAGYAHTQTAFRARRAFMFITRTEMREAIRILERERDRAIQRYIA